MLQNSNEQKDVKLSLDVTHSKQLLKMKNIHQILFAQFSYLTQKY